MSSGVIEKTRAGYGEFNARDVDTCLASMTSDVDWANGWEGGRVVGREAVRGYWRRQVELIVENLRRYLAGEPLRNQVDRRAGY